MTDRNIFILLEEQKKLKEFEGKLLHTLEKIQEAINYLKVEELEIQALQMETQKECVEEEVTIDVLSDSEEEINVVKMKIEADIKKSIELDLRVSQNCDDEEVESE